MPLRRWTVIGLCPASLGFRLRFIAHDVRDLAAHGPLYDDSFYSFGIARNIALGNGSTFDREHRTNGYQRDRPDSLAAEGIDYGVAHEWILERFLLHDPQQHARFEPITDAAWRGVPGCRALRVVHDVPVVHARPDTHTEPVVGTGGGGAGR
jgi:hypothetical protein